MRYEATFSSYADGSSNVITRTHPYGQMGCAQSMYGGCGGFLELVFEDDEAQKLQTTFGLFPMP